jgi:hypothetical protein
MRPPFPGMDPWLEGPALWPDVHNGLIAAIRDELSPRAAPRYYVAIEQRTVKLQPDPGEAALVADLAVLSGQVRQAPRGRGHEAGGIGGVEVAMPLAVEIDEWFLEVRTEGGQVVTILEILSPSNETSTRDRLKYERKRERISESRTNLVEIDLLRAGNPLPLLGDVPPSDYRILVSRGWQRPRARLIPFRVRDPIPPFPVPLLPDDDEPLLDLGAVLHALHDRARYDLRIRYDEAPVPPLREEDAAWAREIVGRR